MLTREPTWTAQELVAALGVSRQTIQRLARAYGIRRRGAYRRHRFTQADIAVLEAKLTELAVTGRARRAGDPGRMASRDLNARPVPSAGDEETIRAELAELRKG